MATDYIGRFMQLLDAGMRLRQHNEQLALRKQELALRGRAVKAREQADAAQREQEAIMAEMRALQTTRDIQEIYANVDTQGPITVPSQVGTRPQPVEGPAPAEHGVVNVAMDKILGPGSEFQVPIYGRQEVLKRAEAARLAKEGIKITEPLLALLTRHAASTGMNPEDLPAVGEAVDPEYTALTKDLSQAPAPVDVPPGAKLYGLEGPTDPRLLDAISRQRTQEAISSRQDTRLRATIFDASDPVQQQSVDQIFERLQRGEIDDVATASTMAEKVGKGASRALYDRLAESGAIIPTAKQRERIGSYDTVINHVQTIRDRFEEVRRLVDTEGWDAKTAFQATGLLRMIQASATLLPEAWGDKGRKSDQDVERSLLAMPGWLEFTVAPDLAYAKLDELLSSAREGQQAYMDNAFATYRRSATGGVERVPAGGAGGEPIGTTSKPDGIYPLPDGSKVRVQGGKVYPMEGSQ